MSVSALWAAASRSSRNRARERESAHSYQSRKAAMNEAIIKVLIAEDQEYLREGVVKILSEQPNMQVIGSAADGLAALQLAWDLDPNVILLDIHMPRMNGIE